MSGEPDFDKYGHGYRIARDWASGRLTDPVLLAAAINEAVRLVWNARGAADISTLQAHPDSMGRLSLAVVDDMKALDR